MNELIALIAAIGAIVTPIMLAFINRRQTVETAAKVERLNEMHAETLRTIGGGK